MIAKVLIIDDEPDSVQAVVDSYRGDDSYKIYQAYSGLEGLRLIDEVQPSVIVLDIIMYPMDGYEVLRRLQSKPATANIPVVIFSVTGVEDPNDEKKIQAIRLGADYFIAKKRDLRELRVCVERASRRNSQSALQGATIRIANHTLEILDSKCNQVKLDHRLINLSHQLAQTLNLLYVADGETVNIAVISSKIYHDTTSSATKDAYRLVDRLKRKIEPDYRTPVFIKNIPSYGYKLVRGET